MDKFSIDSHKLMFHPKLVTKWLNGKTISPIYMEVSLSSYCNYACNFCGLDFMRTNKHIDGDALLFFLRKVAKQDTRAVMFGGEGEPLMHPEFTGIIQKIPHKIDLSLTTNGSLFNIYPEKIENAIMYSRWIRISFNAGTPETYAKVHGVKPELFSTVIDNIKAAAILVRKEANPSCVIGMQMLLLPDNIAEIEDVIKIAIECGVDYLVLKPYSHHADSKHEKISDTFMFEYMHEINSYRNRIEYIEFLQKKYSFPIIFRKNALRVRNYETCYALPFWSYIDTMGQIYRCSSYLGNEDFRIGNLNSWDFSKNLMTTCGEGCRKSCRMDSVNRYLNKLLDPGKHVNFI